MEEKSNKGFGIGATIVLWLVVSIVFGVGGWFLGIKYANKEQQVNDDEFEVKKAVKNDKYAFLNSISEVFEDINIETYFYLDEQELVWLNEDVEETKTFLEKLIDLLQFLIPKYKAEGKSQVIIGIGCTGGQHRSVAIAEYLSHAFEKGYKTNATHRDIHRAHKK